MAGSRATVRETAKTCVALVVAALRGRIRATRNRCSREGSESEPSGNRSVIEALPGGVGTPGPSRVLNMNRPWCRIFLCVLVWRWSYSVFSRGEVAPLPGPLPWIKASVVHPHGTIDVDLHFEKRQARGTVCLPKDTGGYFRWGKARIPLNSGLNRVKTGAG